MRIEIERAGDNASTPFFWLSVWGGDKQAKVAGICAEWTRAMRNVLGVGAESEQQPVN
jgi:hypothetical protein